MPALRAFLKLAELVPQAKICLHGYPCMTRTICLRLLCVTPNQAVPGPHVIQQYFIAIDLKLTGIIFIYFFLMALTVYLLF